MQHQRHLCRKAIELYGEYSESEAHLFEQLVSEGDIVVEVGSNIGGTP